MWVFAAVREGNLAEAVRIGNAGSIDQPLFLWLPMLQASLSGRPQSQVHQLAAAATEATLRARDSEQLYFTGMVVAVVGERDAALRLLRRAVEKNYCATAGYDQDPSFASLRGMPEFQQIRQAAADCQARFLAFRAQDAP
jgi:hypothetical protein